MEEIGLKFRIGDRAVFSKTLSECDVYLFAGITGDMNFLHINALKAGNSFAGARIVHGALVSGLVSAAIGMKLPGEGTIYLEQNAKFLKPVYIGDTVRAVVEVTEIINELKQIIRLKTSVYNQEGEMVLDGYAVVKAPDRNACLEVAE